MPHKLKYTNEDLLNRAREFFKKNNKPPRIADFKAGYVVTAKKRFGSWAGYIDASLKIKSNYHNWSREELQSLVRAFWKKNNRFPADGELTEDGRDVGAIIKRYWGSTNEFFEASLGTSPRIEILRALQILTPPGCEVATPAEIIAEIRKKIQFPTNLCSMNARFLSADGYITGGKYDRTRWWKLTPAGKSFLKSFAVGCYPPASVGDH